MASSKEYTMFTSEALAAIINDLQHWGQASSRHIIAIKMAEWYAVNNEDFDKQRFFDACDIYLTAGSEWMKDFDQQKRNRKERLSVKN